MQLAFQRLAFLPHLCYNLLTLKATQKNKLTDLPCSTCGAPLILTEEKTELLDKSIYPVTSRTYICSNKECQDERDKKAAAWKKHKEEAEAAKAARMTSRPKIIK